MIDVSAFVKDALQPWNSARCNCVSAVAAALADAPKCATAFQAWLAQPVADRRAQARAAHLLEPVQDFAEIAGLHQSAEPNGWGVLKIERQQIVGLRHRSKWLVRIWPRGVVLVPHPIVLRQWEVA